MEEEKETERIPITHENENYKKYRAQGIDEKYVPNEEWMSELGNEYYMIWAPQTNRRTKMEVVKAAISRDDYGCPKVYGTYLDKPYHGADWNSYFPRYCWGDAHEFMGIKLTDDNKLSCLVFDNEQEAREFCNKYNEWKENKDKKRIKDILKSDSCLKKETKRLNLLKEFVNGLTPENIDMYWAIDKLFESVAGKLNWYKEEIS